ncbi:hypothetical protein P8452_71517 [Trifolium repens]|nr:hypothetical protein P8452_71517 [Trifolium repens]
MRHTKRRSGSEIDEIDLHVSFDNARENNNKSVDTINLQNSKPDSTANNMTVVVTLKAMKTADNSTSDQEQSEIQICQESPNRVLILQDLNLEPLQEDM